MNESISQTMELAIGLVTAYGLNVIGAILILIIGWIAAGWCSRTIARLLSRSDKVDAMLTGFFASFVNVARPVSEATSNFDDFSPRVGVRYQPNDK